MSVDRTNGVHWVYRCYDSAGHLLYVGSTGDLFGRLTTHSRSTWWAPQVARVAAKVYPTGVAAREVERTAIRNEIPRWNRNGKWAGRHNWDQDDWSDWLTVLVQAGDFAGAKRAARDFQALYQCRLPEHIAEAIDAHDDRVFGPRDELTELRSRRTEAAS